MFFDFIKWARPKITVRYIGTNIKSLIETKRFVFQSSLRANLKHFCQLR